MAPRNKNAFPTTQLLIPPYHKLHIADPRLGLHMRDVGTRGEVVDVEGTAHVVDGEEGEDGALNIGHGDGDDGELLLALDGDPLGGRVGPQPHTRSF